MCFSSRRRLRCIGGATESIGSVKIPNAVTIEVKSKIRIEKMSEIVRR